MNRLVWFRNDLRLHDNEMLSAALNDSSGKVVYVFIFEESWNAKTSEDSPRVGVFRKKFLAESLSDLRLRLRELGADLVCAIGNPSELIPQICREHQISQIFFSRYASFDEQQTELEVSRRLNANGVEVFAFQTHTLLKDSDCVDGIKDFDLRQPMSFSKLRKYVERSWPVQPLAQMVMSARPSPSVEVSQWPLESYLAAGPRSRGISLFGGETAALARVQEYFWSGDHLKNYKATRNGLLHLNDSSKFSAALAIGCVSARSLFYEVRRYEKERGSNGSTLWFLFELLWRDYFHFSAYGRGHHLFTGPSSVAQRPSKVEQAAKFDDWRNGRVGNAFIDAGMNELRCTGWLSNRMRQNVASYLVHNLGVEWQMGARWFETCLVDYDPCSNWGNWAYIAGSGFNKKPHVFNVDQQARTYDADGTYSQFWSTEKSS